MKYGGWKKMTWDWWAMCKEFRSFNMKGRGKLEDLDVDGRIILKCTTVITCRSQWSRGLRRRSAAARLLRLWVRFPLGGHGRLSLVSVVRYRSLRRADHLSRGVLPSVLRRCVWSRNLVNEGTLAHWGAFAPKTNKEAVVRLGRLGRVVWLSIVTTGLLLWTS